MIGVTMVYLVQHGEKQRLPGDPGLTELGRQQATRTGRWLSGLGVSELWASPMRRARETADCITAVTAIEDLNPVMVASVSHLDVPGR
jgi:broad specificity phosphatase PhoE